MENHTNPSVKPYFDQAFAKKPEFQLFNIKKDPFCKEDLAGKAEYAAIEKEMKEALVKKLEDTQDPRVVGPDKEIFDSYIRYMGVRNFPKPDWAK